MTTEDSHELPSCLLADDHPVIRDGIRLRLLADDLVRVCCEASTGDEALDCLRRHQPEVALVDLRMPGLDGLQLAEVATREQIETRLVIVSAFTERSFIERALDVGAQGFVAKDSPLDVVVAAVRTVLNDGRYIDPSLTALLLGPPDVDLSTRELEVLRLMGEGMQNKAIALELGISEETVKTYVTSLLRKLDATSRTGAVVAAMRRSLIA